MHCLGFSRFEEENIREALVSCLDCEQSYFNFPSDHERKANVKLCERGGIRARFSRGSQEIARAWQNLLAKNFGRLIFGHCSPHFGQFSDKLKLLDLSPRSPTGTDKERHASDNEEDLSIVLIDDDDDDDDDEDKED